MMLIPLPEMTLRAAAVVPPTVVFCAPEEMPKPSPLAMATVPAAFVQLKLPWTMLLFVPVPVSTMPRLPLDETILRAAGGVLPLALLAPPERTMTALYY